MTTKQLLVTTVSFFTAAATVMAVSIIMYLMFDKNFSNTLVRASNAATVESANAELTKALSYLENNNLTKGSTRVFYETPAKDIEFFYNNLKSSQEELNKLSGDRGSQLDKSNALMRFHEVILTEDGAIDVPDDLNIYPHQRLIYLLFALFSSGFIVSLIKLNWSVS